MSLAAFRWLANTIENFAIELYATDRESFRKVEGVLRNTLKQLKETRKDFAVSEEENGCPDGYVLCHGICAPSCEYLSEASASTERAAPTGRGSKRKGY
ncbi:MAG TPA: hypothetical protein VJ813_09930 [Vicinamibacterales bacterium]|nr:hypothetical protein [Vicinamibacterales bacterium]